MYMECTECLRELMRDDIIFQIDNENLCQRCFVEKIFHEQEYALDENLRMFVQVDCIVFGDE